MCVVGNSVRGLEEEVTRVSELCVCVVGNSVWGLEEEETKFLIFVCVL